MFMALKQNGTGHIVGLFMKLWPILQEALNCAQVFCVFVYRRWQYFTPFNTGNVVGGVCNGRSGDTSEIFFGSFCREPEGNTGTLSVLMAFWPKFGMGISQI